MIQIFTLKRYEYEKLLMELEDARNNKNEDDFREMPMVIELIYTSAADEDV